jgi:hypothetical protein
MSAKAKNNSFMGSCLGFFNFPDPLIGGGDKGYRSLLIF